MNKDAGELLKELVDIMRLLRSDKGCPWDRVQTHSSLKASLIEETYEVIEAIDEEDFARLREELGDLLLQIVFHAQIASEEGKFNICDVVEGICAKMRHRHPHVFGDATVKDAEEVLARWHEMKAAEKGSASSVLAGIPKSLPALLRAWRVQRRASKVGFDWENAGDVLKKVREEFRELESAVAAGDREGAAGEIGDLLFSIVNLARFLDVEPEEALQCTVDKFIRRFQYIEKALKAEGKSLKHATLEEMDKLWEESKQAES